MSDRMYLLSKLIKQKQNLNILKIIYWYITDVNKEKKKSIPIEHEI